LSTLVSSTTEEGSSPGAHGEEISQPQLYRVTNCGQPLGPSSRHGLRETDLVILGRGPAGAVRGVEDGQRVLRLSDPDGRISSAHAQLRRMTGRWVVEDLDSRNGTILNGEPVRAAPLHHGDLLELGRTFFLFREAVPTPTDQPADVVVDGAVGPAIGTLCPPLARDLRALAAVARSTVSVVIHGETGTGKELVARAVHALSGRPGPFIAVNCGAIPDSLVESELFGVKRGAYSDAREDRPGLIRSAHQGTLFLDEIGDLPLSLQSAFLRALQEREVVPIGQVRAVPVDLRVVSASHRAIGDLAASGEFREDLWARLSGFTIRLPPLRERREDLGILVRALVERLAPDPARISFSTEAMRLLIRHTWPRNIRELEKILGAALVLAGDGPILPAHLGDLRDAPPAPPAALPADAARRIELARLLEEHQGNLSAVARALGRDRALVRRWLRRAKLDPDSYRR
jgi:sigma-54 dependent transcriptional regulator, acetoin dehydrogenase operon transcriptional activator AcoR